MSAGKFIVGPVVEYAGELGLIVADNVKHTWKAVTRRRRPLRLRDLAAHMVAIGYRSLALCNLDDGQRLGLTGFGASAHLVLKLVAHRFPDCEVFVFARSPKEREFARQLGAVWAGGRTFRGRGGRKTGAGAESWTNYPGG